MHVQCQVVLFGIFIVSSESIELLTQTRIKRIQPNPADAALAQGSRSSRSLLISELIHSNCFCPPRFTVTQGVSHALRCLPRCALHSLSSLSASVVFSCFFFVLHLRLPCFTDALACRRPVHTSWHICSPVIVGVEARSFKPEDET